MTSAVESRRYWSFQFAGWLGYSAIGLAINLLNGASPGPLLAGHVALVACSIGLTHLLRIDIRRQRREGRSPSAMPLFLAARVLLISVVQAALVIGLNVALTGGGWDTTSIVALWWGMLLATGVWTVLYIRFSERRRHAVREGELQLALREAELHALEAQINPHFLFNCLNSIRALVTIDPPRAQDMLTRLANVLRSSLRHDHGHTVPLAIELATVADYLALESVRFEERLQSQVVAGPEVTQCEVPPLVVQTLVENAIKHGLEPVPGGGTIWVIGRESNGKVAITVADDGRGFSDEGGGTGIGLRNIRERLRLAYGDAASFSLVANFPRGVAATISLPPCPLAEGRGDGR